MFADIARNDLYSLLWRSTTDPTIVKLLSKIRTDGDNPAPSCTNLVNFRPITSEFTLLKRAIFAAIRQQFDHDLHSPPWRSETDWKIAIFILNATWMSMN